VEINYLVCEHLRTQDFPDFDPLLTLESAHKPYQQLKEEYGLSDDLTLVDNKLNRERVCKRWPEDLDGAYERIMWIQEDYS